MLVLCCPRGAEKNHARCHVVFDRVGETCCDACEGGMSWSVKNGSDN